MKEKYSEIEKLSDKMIKSNDHPIAMTHYVKNYISKVWTVIHANDYYIKLWMQEQTIKIDEELVDNIHETLKDVDKILEDEPQAVTLLLENYERKEYCPKLTFQEIIKRYKK